jgi:hypothetical protein
MKQSIELKTNRLPTTDTIRKRRHWCAPARAEVGTTDEQEVRWWSRKSKAQQPRVNFPSRASHIAAISFAIFALTPELASEDEGGVSFWIPGFFGSLAAVPGTPGWSVTEIYYHDAVSAGGDVARAREIEIGRIPANLNVNLNASVNANVNLGFVAATYVFATPVLGGQASAGLLGAYGNNSTSLAASLTGTLTGPGGATFPFSRFDTIDSSLTAFGDLIPSFELKWNSGVNNYMTYVTADLPAGAYQSTRLANLGIGHWAIDAGGGYTYFDQKTGHEFSAVLGFTYNTINPSTSTGARRNF